MRNLIKNLCLLFSVLLVSGCTTYINDEDLKEVENRIVDPVKIVITGLPEHKNDLVISNDDEDNLTLSGAVSVGVSSGDGYSNVGIPYTDSTKPYHYDRYGSKRDVANALSAAIVKWTSANTEVLKHYRPAEGDEILIVVDIRISEIISKIPKVTFSVGAGTVQENTGVAGNASWAKRDNCVGHVKADFNIIQHGKSTKKFYVDIKTDQVKVKNDKAAANAYRRAANQLAKEITFKLLTERPEATD